MVTEKQFYINVTDTIWRKTSVKIPNLTVKKLIDIRYHSIFNINLKNSTNMISEEKWKLNQRI